MRFPFKWTTVAVLASAVTLVTTAAVSRLSGAPQQPAGRSMDSVWQVVAERPAGAVARDNIAGQFAVVTLNRSQFEARMALAGREFDPAADGVVMTLPMPDGTFERFLVRESPILAPELQAAFPEIKTYVADGLDDPSATARFGWTSAGFHSIAFSAERGTTWVDPYEQGNVDTYVVFNKADFRKPGESWMCLVEGRHDEAFHRAENAFPISHGTQLRTYRLALAATAEYTALAPASGGNAAGSKAAALARMTTTMNRVNGIYERELSVRMTMATGTQQDPTALIFTDAATDGYTNNDGGAMLTENQTKLDTVILPENYDIGHVFSTGGGGVAYLGSPCNNTLKAGGVTGSSNPTGDPFDVDYVAHEMGHQFGGNHTYNGAPPDAASCLTRAATAAYEPASGVTIQAYAGICGTQNLQPNSIDRFHVKSLDEMTAFLTDGGGKNCGTGTATNNTPPVVGTLQNYTIPVQTPFMLTGSATDANNDSLTYAWEQYDLGAATTTVTAATTDQGSGPLFRSYSASTSPTRMFPSSTYILNNANVPPTTYACSLGTCVTGETLPNTARTMNFQLTVRDNRSGGGAFSTGSMTVTTVTGATFAVTSHTTNAAVTAGGTTTVTWNNTNTTTAPISTANVSIRLSTDGGQTFPVELSASTANDGTEVVTIPANTQNTTQARLLVQAVGNIYFDVNDTNFQITGGATATVPGAPAKPTGTAGNGSVNLSWTAPTDTGGSAITGYQVQQSATANGTFTNVAGCPTNSTTTSCNITGLTNNTQVFFKVAAINAIGTGAFSPASDGFTPTAGGGGGSTPSAPAKPTATAGNASATLTWTAPADGGSPITGYQVQQSTSATGTFTNTPSCPTNNTSTSCNVTGLVNGTTYFFKVAASNTNGISTFSPASDGVTPTAPCTYTLGSDRASVDRLLSNETVTVTPSGSTCAWTATVATDSTSMLSITTGASGTGSGTVAYQVSANPGTTTRTGTMTIAGQTFTVTQSADSYTVDITVQQGTTAIRGAFVALVGTGTARPGLDEGPQAAADGTRRKFGAVSGSTGVARFRGVVPGTYTMKAHSGGRSVTSGTITVGPSVLSGVLSMSSSSSSLTTLGAYGSQTGTIVADGQSGVFYLNTTAIPSLYRTTDHGGNWSPVTLSSDDPATGLDASSTAGSPTTSGYGGEIATIVGNKVWYSFDFGLTWASMTAPTGVSNTQMFWAHINDGVSTVSQLFLTGNSTATMYAADMTASTPALTAMASSYKTNPGDYVAVGNGSSAPVIAVFDAVSGSTKFWAVDATPASTDASVVVSGLGPTTATNGTTALGASDVTLFKIGGPATGVTIGSVSAPNTVLIYALKTTGESNVRFSTCTASTCSFPLTTRFKNTDDSTSTTAVFSNTGGTSESVSLCAANFGAVGSIAPTGGYGSVGQCWLTLASSTLLEVRAVQNINNNTGLAYDAAYDGTSNMVMISGDGQHGAVKAARMTTGAEASSGLNRPYFPGFPNIASAGTGTTTGGIAVQGITSAVIRQSLYQPASSTNMASLMSFTGGGRTIGSTDGGTTWFTLTDRGGARMDWWTGATSGSQWMAMGTGGAGQWMYGTRLAAATDFTTSTTMPNVKNGSGNDVGPSDFSMTGTVIQSPGVWGLKGISGTDYVVIGSYDGASLRVDLSRLTYSSPSVTLGSLTNLFLFSIPDPPMAGDQPPTANAVPNGQNAGTFRMAYCPATGSNASVADTLFVAMGALNSGDTSVLRKYVGIGAGAALSTPSFTSVTSTALTVPSGSNLRDIAVDCTAGTVWLARSTASGGGPGGGTPTAGVLKSTDGGATFTAITLPTGTAGTALQNVVALDFNKTTTSQVVAISRQGDVVVTNDGGGTWTMVNDTSQAACVGQTTQCGRGFGGEEPGGFSMPPVTGTGDAPVRAGDTISTGLLGSGAGLHQVRITTPDAPGTIAVSASTLNYSGVNTGGTLSPLTPAQTVTVTATGNNSITWTASANQPWVQITGGSGTGSGTFTVGIINPSNTLAGQTSATATVTITATNTTNSPRTITVNLTLRETAQLQAPFGSFDTPTGATPVSGSIAVTGWALDDVGIDRVEIWRDRIDGDPAPPFLENGHPANGKVFIANGTFVEGTRNDVANIHTTMPFRQRAGWGYLLLTWGFPNSNGTFTLTAIAWDKDNKYTVLGTKTITVNNATSTKPFGSIDTPAYGATFSGHNFTFGWALTPVSGCTVAGGSKTMTIDSVPAAGSTPYAITYGSNRTDIAAAFPGFADSNGAGGAAALDSRTYANGTYQIGWLVYDSCNNGEGIGSRFFQILNGSSADVAAFREADAAAKAGGPANAVVGSGPRFRLTGSDSAMTSQADAGTPLWLVRGIGQQPRRIATGSTVWLSQTGRIEVHATAPDGTPGSDETFEAYLDQYGTLQPLPLGSSFDRTRGVFSWQPVAGFLGEYPLRIVRLRGGVADAQWTTRVVVSPGVDETLLQLDRPTDVSRCAVSCALSSSEALEIAGWALDPRATDGAGIGHVHVWATRRGTDAPQFLGAATTNLARADVAATYGAQFELSGYSLTAAPLSAGTWDLTVYTWSLESGRWEATKTVTLVVR